MPLFAADYNSQHAERKREGRAFVEAMERDGYAEHGASHCVKEDVLMMLGHAVQWGRQQALHEHWELLQAAKEQDAPEPEGSRFENLEIDALDLEK